MRVLRDAKLKMGRAYRSAVERGKRVLATVNERPIFVLGNQKSGTTAIAALLGRYTGLSATLDLTTQHSTLVVDIHRDNAPLGALVQQNELEFSRDIVKDPSLTFLYPDLHNYFAEPRFVSVVRDPRSNVRSILDRLDFPGDREQLRINEHWESLTRYEGMYEAWMTVLDSSWMGIQAENYVDMLAGRWQQAARVYLEHEKQIELIRYEDFLDDKVRAIKDLAARLELSRKNDIQNHVDRQFQPRGSNRDISWIKFFGTDNLRRIEARCKNEMTALGYTDFCVSEG